MLRILHLLFFLPFTAVLAQSPALEAITVEQGLSQGFIASMGQDEDGFLWFATSNGLNRYDGYEFSIFRNDPYDTLSIRGNGIFSMAPSGEFLWLMPDARQFNILHRATHRAYLVPVDLSNLNEYLKVVPERKNAVWLLLVMDGIQKLFYLKWAEDFMAQIERGAKPETLFVWKEMDSQVNDMEISEDGRKLWILGEDEVRVLHIASGKIEHVPLPLEMRGLKKVERVQLLNNLSIKPDIAGGAWVSARNYLARYDGRQWRVFSLRFKADGVLHSDRKTGMLWMRSDSVVYGFDLQQLPPTPTPKDASYRLSIPEQAICSLTDRDGNVWFGTNTRGIRKFSPRRNVFKNYFAGNSFYATPVFDNKGRIWLSEPGRGTLPAGIFDLSNGAFQTFPQLNIPVWGNEALRIASGTGDRIWMATGNGWNMPRGSLSPMLIEYSQRDGLLDTIPFPKSFNNPFRFEINNQVPGEIWCANHYQLMRFDIATRTFSLFEMQSPPRGISGIYALVRTSGGVWWAGTPHGLVKAVPDGNDGFSFSLLRTNPTDHNSLPGNVVKSLLPDPVDPNLLWIGTSDNGMSRLDIQQNRFTHYNTENGLPDNTVYGIVSEPVTDKRKSRALWISTNRGLTRFSPEDGNFQYFFKSDGLQENEFNTYAHGVSPKGELMFGGINGLTVFNPADISVSARLPSIKITGLKVNGKALSPRHSQATLQTDICFASRIELSYNQNNLQLTFAADDYTNPTRNQFAFYLEGAEAEWAHRGFEHTAQYLNLAPGQYVFHVKAANSDGMWNERPVSLIIIIQPPWYRTLWAYVLYALLLTGTGYAFYRTQLKRKLERAEAGRLKEMDEFKSRFFTNISHEFRTPLTVILGATEELSAETAAAGQNKLMLVRRSGENLLRLVNQILDLAKLESNTLKINYIQGNVPTYLNYVAESLYSLANARNVLLQVENKAPEVIMDYDPERLLQIAYNLLSNAIKFTPSGGKVVMKIDLAPDVFGQQKPALRLMVADTGAGIPEEDKPYLFDRFFQARNQAFAKSGGSGIGLSLTKELVKAMGGSISVESEEGAGATFTVLLPIHQNAPLAQWQDSSIVGSPLSTASGGGMQRVLPGKQVQDSDLPSLLIIEDNPDVVEYLGACLESAYQLSYAYNGRAGIEKAIEMIPDIIISDVMMPEKDGFEVCETLKLDERSSHIPIVLLTAKATVEDRIAGLRRGADAYMAKPFHRKELLATLDGLIELRKKLQQRYTSAPLTMPPAPDAAVQMEDAFLTRLREAVEERLDDSGLTGEEVCRKLGMSYPVVYRKLSALTGRSLNVYIRLIRLQKARELLSDTQLTVSEIAYQTGFNDPKFFSRVFAEEFKTTPTDFRKFIS